MNIIKDLFNSNKKNIVQIKKMINRQELINKNKLQDLIKKVFKEIEKDKNKYSDDLRKDDKLDLIKSLIIEPDGCENWENTILALEVFGEEYEMFKKNHGIINDAFTNATIASIGLAGLDFKESKRVIEKLEEVGAFEVLHSQNEKEFTCFDGLALLSSCLNANILEVKDMLKHMINNYGFRLTTEGKRNFKRVFYNESKKLSDEFEWLKKILERGEVIEFLDEKEEIEQFKERLDNKLQTGKKQNKVKI